MRKPLITGMTGQDGSYLAELLLAKGYDVHGLVRRSSSFSTGRVDHLYQDPHAGDTRLHLHYGDLSDSSSLIHTLNRIRPDDVYNLGAQSHVKVSFEMPEFTADTTAMGTLRLLVEAIHCADWPIRFYQAGSSEMFGKAALTVQYREAQRSYLDPLLSHDVEACSGAFLLTPADLFDELGSWDEGYWFYGEDLDYCWRVGQGRYRIRYVADAVAVHDESTSGKRRRWSELTAAERNTRSRVQIELLVPIVGPSKRTLRAKPRSLYERWCAWPLAPSSHGRVGLDTEGHRLKTHAGVGQMSFESPRAIVVDRACRCPAMVKMPPFWLALVFVLARSVRYLALRLFRPMACGAVPA